MEFGIDLININLWLFEAPIEFAFFIFLKWHHKQRNIEILNRNIPIANISEPLRVRLEVEVMNLGHAQTSNFKEKLRIISYLKISHRVGNIQLCKFLVLDAQSDVCDGNVEFWTIVNHFELLGQIDKSLQDFRHILFEKDGREGYCHS